MKKEKFNLSNEDMDAILGGVTNPIELDGDGADMGLPSCLLSCQNGCSSCQPSCASCTSGTCSKCTTISIFAVA